MNKENCALKLVDEIFLYYDARSRKLQVIPVVYAKLIIRKRTVYNTTKCI